MSLPYTIDDHFVFGYNKVPFVPKKDFVKDKFFCTYSRCQREPEDFKTECINTAIEVSNQAKKLGRIPYVLLSGGLDSEVTVKAFMDAKVEFKAITFRYPNDLTYHEEHFINEFVKHNKIDHSYYEIDPQWLLSEQAWEWAHQSVCIGCQMLPHMKLMHHVWFELNGMPVLGNGDIYVSKEINKQWLWKDKSQPKYEWVYIEFEAIVAWYRFAVAYGILGSIGFFSHNPYINLAMIREPLIQKCINDEIPYKLSVRTTKPLVYQKYWPDLNAVRLKYHGSEHIHGMCVSINRKLQKTMRYHSVFVMPIKEYEQLLAPLPK